MRKAYTNVGLISGYAELFLAVYSSTVMNQKFFIFIFPNIILVVTKYKLKDSSKE